MEYSEYNNTRKEFCIYKKAEIINELENCTNIVDRISKY
jgi:hypothetical protein